MRISGKPGPFSPPVDAGQSITERFERCARLHADRTAVVSETWPATYFELDQASNRLGRSLLAHPGAAGDRVAVIARHDAPLLAAVLGVLKAGRCAVILNPTDPDARLVQTLRHAEATQIVADAGHLPLARRVAVSATGFVERIIRVDDCLHGEPTASPGVVVDPGAMAFLVYTSGSTGTPKGVIRSHRNMVHNTGRLATCFRIEPADRLALLVSLGTGNGIALALAALLTGAAVCPFPVMDRGIAGLPGWMRAAGVTIYSSSSSLFRSLMRVVPEGESFPGIRLVRLSSEPAQIADVSAHRGRFSSGCRFIHTLASSETGTIASCELTDAEFAESGRIPVGEALSEDVEIRLLDAEGREVPPGEIGEVTVRSRYLASGYWRAPELTAEKFTFVDGVATFRSGDCARLNARGQLEFTGRRDARLKIRGFRIEPSEVEAAIRRHPGVAEVVAGTSERDDGEPRFVAWVARRRDARMSAAELRESLRAVLPSHAIPSDFVFLEQLPISPNGKVDRAKLRTLAGRSTGEPLDPTNEPRTPTEVGLARIWAGVFQRPHVGREDDFYDLGGDSLVAAGIAAHVHAAWGVELPMSLFHALPTVKALAAAIDSGRRAEPSEPLPRADTSRPVSLSFAQELMWDVSQTPAGLAAYTMANTSRLLGDLNVAALRGSMAQLVARHDIMRTTFHAVDGAPKAVVHPSAPPALEILDFSDGPDPEQAARSFFRDRVRDEPFVLGRLPLMRFWLVRIREREHWFMRAHHHILSDSWSWKVYLDELALLYEAEVTGESVRLPPAPQYADFAAWQRQSMDAGSPGFRRDVSWWAERLANHPPALELPFARAEPVPDAAPEDGVIWWGMPPDVSARMDRLATRHNATWFGSRLAVFAAALIEAGGPRDLVIGTYATGRNRMDLRSMFGMLANMVTLRLTMDPAWTFERLLHEVGETVAAATEHAAIPYQLLCRELAAVGTPAPEIRGIFSVSDHHDPRSFGGIEVTQVERTIQSMPWGFSMKLDRHNEDRCHTSFDPRLYDPRGVRSFLGRYLELLDILSSRPDVPLERATTDREGKGRRAA